MGSSGDPPPLAGFRVLHFTRFLAGPQASWPGFDIMAQGGIADNKHPEAGQ